MKIWDFIEYWFTSAIQPNILTVLTVMQNELGAAVRDSLVIFTALYIIHDNRNGIFIYPGPVKITRFN